VSPQRPQRAARGGGEKFAAVYDDHVWDVFGFFGYRVRTREEAEDLTQATFERALRAWQRFDEKRATARTWLMSIAHNLLVDHYRRDRSDRHDPVPVEDHQELDAGELLEESVLGISSDLAEALQQLSDRDREVIALRFGGDLTGPEISEVTGLTLTNVQQILSRSLRRLREELEDPVGGRATRPPVV
jgi:RNA polymerase sigma-70 factor (ECF subfamily)